MTDAAFYQLGPLREHCRRFHSFEIALTAFRKLSCDTFSGRVVQNVRQLRQILLGTLAKLPVGEQQQAVHAGH